jgi:hypothetical protein
VVLAKKLGPPRPGSTLSMAGWYQTIQLVATTCFVSVFRRATCVVVVRSSDRLRSTSEAFFRRAIVRLSLAHGILGGLRAHALGLGGLRVRLGIFNASQLQLFSCLELSLPVQSCRRCEPSRMPARSRLEHTAGTAGDGCDTEYAGASAVGH